MVSTLGMREVKNSNGIRNILKLYGTKYQQSKDNYDSNSIEELSHHQIEIRSWVLRRERFVRSEN